jgi:hypothetical protein
VTGLRGLRAAPVPAQLKYKMLADMACNKIIAGINRKFIKERPIKAVLDPYNPIGSTTAAVMLTRAFRAPDSS